MDCLVCRQQLIEFRFKGGYKLGRCPQCAFQAVTTAVTQTDIDAYYQQDYYSRDHERYNATDKSKRQVWIRRLSFLSSELRNRKTQIRILDIGCGTGVFLELAQREGWDVWGIEIADDGREMANQRLGGERVFADIQELPSDGQFDIITMWAIIEHLPNPELYVANVARCLAADGVVAIATPNTRSLNYRLFGSRWRYMIPPEHLVYFNLDNLAMLVEKYGLVPIKETTRYSYRAFWEGFSLSSGASANVLIKVGNRLLRYVAWSAEYFGAGDNIEAYYRAERSSAEV